MCECTGAWRGVSRLSRLVELAFGRVGAVFLFVFRLSRIRPAGAGAGPATGKGPEVEVDTGFVDGPQASFMAATQRSHRRTRHPPASGLACAPILPPSSRVFKDTGHTHDRQTSNSGRHLFGDGRRNGGASVQF